MVDKPWDGYPDNRHKNGWHLVHKKPNPYGPSYDEVWYWQPTSDLPWQRKENGLSHGWKVEHFVRDWDYLGSLVLLESDGHFICGPNHVLIPQNATQAQGMILVAENWLKNHPQPSEFTYSKRSLRGKADLVGHLDECGFMPEGKA